MRPGTEMDVRFTDIELEAAAQAIDNELKRAHEALPPHMRTAAVRARDKLRAARKAMGPERAVLEAQRKKPPPSSGGG